MGYYLFPLLVFVFFQGIFALEDARVRTQLPSTRSLQAAHSGIEFINYRNAVATYQRLNPAFIGQVPSAALVAQGNQFSAQFLVTAGNSITQIGGGTGRIITCFADLQPGALAAALRATSNDVALGIAQGGNWSSYAQGAINAAEPLATAVPDGYVVSVIQIGS